MAIPRPRLKSPRLTPKLVLSVALVMVALLVALALGVQRYYVVNLRPPSTSQRSISVTIPDGASTREVSSLLKNAGVIRNAWAFERFVKNHNADLKIQAGTYNLSPSNNVSEIVAIITEGKVATNLITILPGKRLDEIKKIFQNAGFSQSVIDGAFNPSLYKNHPALADKPVGASLEGYLYPESFQRTSTTKPEEIITDSLDEMQKRLDSDIRQAFAKQGLSVFQAITLASIVEREVSKPEDRPQVAQVFLKRLSSGMVLGSDVTVLYGSFVSGQGNSLTFDSPYNTHIHTGLPPGPISNVTDTSLKAVAYPAATDWLYFVTGDNGTTYFSHTLAEHEANVAAHCHKLCPQ